MSRYSSSMILYIKRGCPWCDDAESWLRQHGMTYRAVDVLSNSGAFATMRSLSGQTKAPVLVTGDGRFLADFGVEELPSFLSSEAA